MTGQQSSVEDLDTIADTELVDWTLASLDSIASVAETAGDIAVPSCPLWTMTDLVAHVGRLYAGWYCYNLTRQPDDNDSLAAKESAEPLPERRLELLVPYLRRAARTWADTVVDRDPDRPVWALVLGTEPARFWIRRAVSEAAIHRWDAENAAGSVVTMPVRQSAMSIEETMKGLWTAMIRQSDHPELVDLKALERRRTEPMRLPALPADPIGIVAIDSGISWTVQVVDRKVLVARDRRLPPTRLTGTGHDIYLYMWGRKNLAELGVEGDPKLLDSLNICALAAP